MDDPDVIGGYRLIKKLGEGAAGEVFLASPLADTVFARAGQPLALKLYKPSILKEPEQPARIRREFKTGSMLDHPNLVRIHELGESTVRVPYLVMEYVDGIDLLQWVRQFHPISGRLLLRIVDQLLSALDELHSHGIIHRDLKPTNIMISASFEAKIMDFGVVRITSAGVTEVTPKHKFLGTIRNSSPEMLMGEEYDHRTDLYSLGTVLYLLLYGEEVFAEEDQFARLVTLVQRQEPSFGEHAERDEFTRALLDVTRALLSKRPDGRPQDVDEVRRRLEAVRHILHEERPVEPLHGYIATALTGLDKDARQHIAFASKTIAEAAKRHELYVYQPRIVTDPVANADVEASAVYDLDRRRVVSSDLLLVLANRPSFGVGQEVEIAASYGIPTLLIYEKGTQISRMILGSNLNIKGTVEYESPEQLERALHKILSRVLPAMRQQEGLLHRDGIQRLEVATRLGVMRRRKGYESREDFARALGLSPDLITRLERGVADNVSLQLLARILTALGTNIGALLGTPTVPESEVERDPSLDELETVARRLGWPASVYFDLREEHLRQMAAKGESRVIDAKGWVARKNALEQRQMDEDDRGGGPVQGNLL